MNRVIKIFDDFLQDVRAENQTRSSQSRPRVLVVEDEDIDRLRLEEFLFARNCEVIPCVTSDQAMEMINVDGVFDLAFLDLNLPGTFTGAAIMRRLKQKFPKIFVVVITGAVKPDTLEETRGLGPYGMILKPLEEKDVNEIVDKHKVRGIQS